MDIRILFVILFAVLRKNSNIFGFSLNLQYFCRNYAMALKNSNIFGFSLALQ